MSTQHEFESAASYLSEALPLSKIPIATKLELYGLFKYVTESSSPSSPRPSVFDMAQRAKWDAWSSTGQKYYRKQDAQERYLEIAGSLGWTNECSSSRTLEKDSICTKEEGSRIIDRDSGMSGAVVSVMELPREENDASIFGLAISNDVSGLERLLDQFPETDINERDRFGYTPLHLACDRGNLNVVETLIKKGADPGIKDPDGLSALELAQTAGQNEVHCYLLLR